jgi:hypothetical protein
VAELEKQNLDAKLEIDSLEASPVVLMKWNADCPFFLADLAMFKEKHASKCEELDVLRVEVAEFKSRYALLGTCTSCPVLHNKIDEMHAYTISLKAMLKEPIPTSCSTCEVHALKNLELAHYVDRLQDENDELRKMMGWLSGHEPQLRMMIEAYKCYDRQALGSEKIGECSSEGGEKIDDIQAPPKTYHNNAYVHKPNPLRNKLDTTPDPSIFPHPTDISKSLSSSRAPWGMCSLGKRVRSQVRRNWLTSQVERNQMSSPIPSLSQNLRDMGTPGSPPTRLTAVPNK